MAEEQDEVLVAAAKAGDRRALKQLVERHYMRIYRLCYRYTGQREDAEDAAQEVFARLGGAVSSYKGEAQFSTWLSRIAINTLHDAHRKRKRKKETPFTESFDAVCEDATPEEQLQKKQVLQILHSLPEKLKQAALLVYGEGMSHAEAGKILGCSEGTVSWRVHEAKKKLLQFKDRIALMFCVWAF